MLVAKQTLRFLSTYILNRIFLICTLLVFNVSNAQECALTLSGKVVDLQTGIPLEGAYIFVKESQRDVAVTDSSGFFEIRNLCPAKYHIQISHIGCKEKIFYVILISDTNVAIHLNHKVLGLSGFNFTIKKKKSSQEIQSIAPNTEAWNNGKDLGKILESISGVSILKNGNTLSKPIVHGMFGNRLAILNNGAVHNGQQWGIDHAPEIDPFMSGEITIIKGVAAISYQSSSLGNVVLIEPEKLQDEPHIHGELKSYFETNGRSAGMNINLQQNFRGLKWRILGTLKNSGDNKSSQYFLKNTGHQQANTSFQLEKRFGKKLSADMYFSSFNSEMGILRGSHIGNITDLNQAIVKDVPFFTESDYSSEIQSPAQKVRHQLFKIHSKYMLSKHYFLDASFFRQQNQRKEFDVRRSGRSEIPSMSLENYSSFGELKLKGILNKKWSSSHGIQITDIKNTNLPETGILPLIPDYYASKFGFYSMATFSDKNTISEFGARMDMEQRNVVSISSSYPRKIVRYNKHYKSFASYAGFSQKISDNTQINYNLGLATRNPEINELYSFGLHQGVSGIEEGDPNLAQEFSIKNTLSFASQIAKKIHFHALFYTHFIKNYIFLNPENEFRLTIRGAFPVFSYKQTDAQISGADIDCNYQHSKKLNVSSRYSFLSGRDYKGIPLVYMPPNNFNLHVNYRLKNLLSFQNIGVKSNIQYVFKQNNYNANQDFLPPPDAYCLIGFGLNASLYQEHFTSTFYLDIQNLLNETYRDYLNRQRYFADDLGINLRFGVNISF